MDLNIVEFLQRFANPVLNYLFYGITQFGDMYFFIFVVALIYWTIDKKFAYKLLFIFAASAFINTIIKVIVKRPRPYENDKIISIFSKTSGYSFPSGHSQSSAVLFHNLKHEYDNKKWIKIFTWTLVILVPISRVYLGQHFASDVIVGVILGLIISVLLGKVFTAMKDKEDKYLLILIPVLLIIMILNLNGDYSKTKELFVAGGGLIGFITGYYFEKQYVKHNPVSNIKIKLVKTVIGFSIFLLAYIILKQVFPADSLLFDGVRYLVLALLASLVMPFIFVKIFQKNN